MSALSRFARGDAAVAALLLSLAAQPAVAAEKAPVAGDAALVTLDAEATKLAQVVEIYRDSAARCLRHQRWMIGEIAAIPASKAEADNTEEGKSPAKSALADPVGLRQARLDLYMVVDPRDAAAEMLGGAPSPASAKSEIERHLALRRACIAWSDRSLTLLKGAINGPVGPAMEARITKAREAASHDEKRIRGMETEKRGFAEADVATLETNGPGF